MTVQISSSWRCTWRGLVSSGSDSDRFAVEPAAETSGKAGKRRAGGDGGERSAGRGGLGVGVGGAVRQVWQNGTRT